MKLQEIIKDYKAGRLSTTQLRDALIEGSQSPLSSPLSEGQKGLWMLHRMNPDASSYNVPICFRLSPQLDMNAFESACRFTVRQHPILSHAIVDTDGELRQVPKPERPPRFLKGDLTGRSKKSIATFLCERSKIPFSLESDSLMRVETYDADGDAQYVLIIIHHIVFDGSSLALFLTTLLDFYLLLTQGRQPKIQNQAARYDDFVEWERTMLKSSVGKEYLDYWKTQLADSSPTLDIPTDRPRIETKGGIGKTYSLLLSKSLSSRIKELATIYKTNRAIVFLAVFKMLLYRYSNQGDIVVGMPTLGRPDERFDSLVGYFINTIAVRSLTVGERSFIELIKELRETVADGLDRSAYPFPALVRELNVARSQNRSPVYQVTFAYQNFMQVGSPDRFRERYQDCFSFEFLDEIRQEGEYELELEIREEIDRFRLSFKYDPKLFDESSIVRMSDSYLRLTEGVIEDPNRKPGEYPILSHEEAHKVLIDWNETQYDYPKELCVHELFERRAADNPNRIAVEEGDRTLTYSELNEKANQAARYLIQRGVKPRTLVATLTPRSIDTIVGLIAILKTGAAYVPIDPQYPQERIDRMMEDCGATFALADASCKKNREFDRCGFVDLKERWNEISTLDCRNLKTQIDSNDLVYVTYTSGTTGIPKGVEIRHKSVHRLVAHRGFHFLNPENTLLQYAPLSFDASTFEIWGALCCGARLVVCPAGAMGLDELGDVIKENGVTVLWLTSALFGQMVENRLSSMDGVRFLLSGGDVLHPDRVRRVLDNIEGVTLIDGYGPTENTTFTTVHVMTRASEIGDSIPIGRPLDNTQAYVLNPDLQPVPVGVVGELYTGGDGLARGYWRRPELTKEKFIDNPFSKEADSKLYKTGDWVSYRPDGTIMFVGRADNQVKIRGFRIEPGEIENRLSDHPQIEDCAVTVKTIDSNKYLVAYYVTKPVGDGTRKPIDRSLLKDWLRSHLPEHTIPSFFIHIEQMPVTPNGKTDRSVLSEREISFDNQPPKDTLPVTDIETHILDIWRDVLGHSRIGPEDGFFDVGGDSLLAVATADRIKQEIEQKFGVTDLFKYSNVREIGAYISRLRGESSGNGSERKNLLPKPPIEPTNGKGKKYTDPSIPCDRSSTVQQKSKVYPDYYHTSLAIIGVSCLFPGANGSSEFWNNIREGKESIRFFSEEELVRTGLSEDIIHNPHFVPLNSTIDGKDRFDADFFNIPPRDAELMDPQIRLLLMHSWMALEDAGHPPRTIPNTAVFVSASGYSQPGSISNTPEHTNVIGCADDYVALILAQSGTIPTMISHKLGLKGPSFSIHSNCSSSLSGLYTAAQCLSTGESEYALVGAANLFPPLNRGYFHQPGLNFSSDGHCRAFDASADGMIGGEGVAVIVLKRAIEAIESGDRIYALLRGIRANNDGDDKVGFYAPSVKGQAEVIQKALNATGVHPETISFVEAHGTGTKLGDPIEFNALTDVYRQYTTKKQFCGIGSVKTNIGHLDTAAGLAGCIKTALSLYHGEIPPTINYETPNPNIQLEGSPFYIANRLKKWDGGDIPQRAALSSFGLGGANAHAIFEAYSLSETDSIDRSLRTMDTPSIVPLSARDDERLKVYADKFVQFLRAVDTDRLNLEDVAFTLQVGRTAFSHRAAFLVKDVNDLIAKLQVFVEGQTNRNGWFHGKSEDTVRIFENDPDFSTVIDKWIENRNVSKLAELWVKGFDLDWERLYSGEKPQRVSLPTYPFAETVYPFPGSQIPEIKPVQISKPQEAKSDVATDLSELMYAPVWEPKPAQSYVSPKSPKTVLVASIGDCKGFGESIKSHFHQTHEKSIVVRIHFTDRTLKQENGIWRIDCNDPSGLEACLKNYDAVDSVFFICGIDSGIESGDYSQATGVRAPEIQLLRLAKYLKKHNPPSHKMDCTILTMDRCRISESSTNPFGGGVEGLVYALAQSRYQWAVRNIDLSSEDLQNSHKQELLLQAILNEKPSARGETVKIENRVRYQQRFNPIDADAFTGPTPLRREGVYVILGGSGSVGRIITRYLIQKYKAKVIWIGRRSADNPAILSALRSFQDLGSLPDYVRADVTDFVQIKDAVENIRQKWGVVHGALFSGVVVQYDNSIDGTSEEDFRKILEVKTLGGIHFYNAFKDDPLDFMCYFSSAQAFSFTGASNLSAYAAGITFADTYVRRIRESSKFPIGIINWGFWMAPKEGIPENAIQFTNIGFLQDKEGYECFERFISLLCAGKVNQALCMRVSPAVEQLMPLNRRTKASVDIESAKLPKETKKLSTLDIKSILVECLAVSLKRSPDRIETNTAFFDYGVDSIISVGFMNKVSDKLGVELNSAVIFDYSTIDRLSSYITETYGDILNTHDTSQPQNAFSPEIIKLQNKYLNGEISADALLEEIEP